MYKEAQFSVKVDIPRVYILVMIRVIIGSVVLTKVLLADCLRFQTVDPLPISNIYIFFCKKEHFW